MLEIFETRKLVQTVNDVKSAPSFITDTFFSNVDVNNAENIDVEIYVGKRKLAPFVSPRVAGVLMESEGKRVDSYKPAYVKFKYATEAIELAAETNGVFYADGSTPTQRGVEKAVKEMQEGVNSIQRRVEAMSTEALTSGVVTISGEGIEDVVDFQMPAANLKTLTGTDLWTDAGSDPIQNLRDWKREIIKTSGVAPDRAIMGSDVVDAFLSNAAVKAYMEIRRMDFGSVKPENIGDGAVYIATIEGLELYSYDAYYTDDAGDTIDLFPVDKILLGSTMAKTVLNYGAIKDLKSGNFVGQYFAKSWEVEDPSARFVLLQSAPLPVPTQVSAFMCNKAV